MSDDTQDLDKITKEYIQQEEIRRRALSGLLDWQLDRENHRIALLTKMGSSKSYLISVSLEWIASHVFFARDLPIFKEHRRAESGEISINDLTVGNLQQREPDYRRQLPMAIYLATREHHKFPPIFLVAYQSWVYDRESDKWGPDGRALESSLNVKPLDSRSSLVNLDITNTSYFALDGQHRLMAIKGLKELLDGRLNAKKKDGSPIPRKSMSRDEVEEHNLVSRTLPGYSIDPLQNALSETIGVEILPAVLIDDTYEEAVSRLRNIFVDVNENAKRLEKGELSLLDENDGFRVVARTLMVTHPIFRQHQDLRVDPRREQLAETSEDYTTLATIVRVAEEYLKKDFPKWKDPILGLKDAGLQRPEDEEIEKGLKKLAEYFTALETLPSHSRMVEGASVSSLRKPDGEDNILFRPIAQAALSRAVAELISEKSANLGDLMGVLAKKESKGDLKLTSKKAPWFGILCDPITEKIRRQKSYEVLCSRMFVHVLGGGLADTQEQETLRRDFFEARQSNSDSDNQVAYDISGKLVLYDQFSLPRPWR